MRISLLLRREPFGQILEKTLARFWQAHYSQVYRVCWYEGCPDLRAIHRRGEQAWLCNIYLNAIFTPDADQAIFDPIRREFARSVVPWRRPLQQAYVALAASRQGAPWLAQAGLGVTPTIPEAAYKLVVAGNHKLRLLDCQAGLAYGILKEGFSPGFMQRELDTRREAAQLGLPVPELEAVAPDGSWFSEHYVSGTPLNRLADQNTAREATVSAANALVRLLAQTLQEESLDEYVARLQDRIRAVSKRSHLLSERQKQQLMERTDSLVKRVSSLQSALGGRILTALTHGDFQPGNILVNEEGAWLIDWEYAARRQVGYDALVFMLHSRFPQGLITRLQTFVTQGSNGVAAVNDVAWPGMNWQDGTRRRVCAALFLLEEVVLHLEENDNSAFARAGWGLLTLLAELAKLRLS